LPDAAAPAPAVRSPLDSVPPDGGGLDDCCLIERFDLRAPLVLRQFEGCSYEQAAEILGVSVSTVRGRISRARRTLLVSMQEWR
jgi:hypothetical protein